MSSLSDIYIKKETLKTLLDILEKKEGKKSKGVFITINTDDQTNEYGQNVSCYVSQTKEQRAEKIKKFYVGNGKVFWTNGSCVVAEKVEQLSQEVKDKIDNLSIDDLDDQLPF